MLADCPIHVTLPATDLDRARRFYAEKLRLFPEVESPTEIDGRTGLFYRSAAGGRFLLYPSQGAANGAHTQMTWTTNNIEAVVAALQARGIVFEEYVLPGLKTVGSIATLGQSKGAWFKDSEGNLLALGQFD